MQAIDIALIVSLLSAAGVISNILMNARKRKKEDADAQSAIEAGFIKLNLKMDQQCSDLRDIARNVEKLADENRRLSEVVVQHGEQIKTLFDRLTKLEGGR